jgi:hypothetical protein
VLTKRPPSLEAGVSAQNKTHKFNPKSLRSQVSHILGSDLMLPVISTKIRTAGLYRVCLNYPSNCSSGDMILAQGTCTFCIPKMKWDVLLSCRWAWASTPAGNRQNKNTQLKTLLANCTRGVWTEKHVFTSDIDNWFFFLKCGGQNDVRDHNKIASLKWMPQIKTKIPSPNRRWAHNQKRAIWEC